MLTAWVFSVNLNTGKYSFEERTGAAGYDSRKAADWGLTADDAVLLVLQQGSFIQAWVKGVALKGRWANG